jgi:hypothetical protein
VHELISHHFHAVEQRSGNGVKYIGSAQEEGVAQVYRGVHVMVLKSVVLAGVQQFEQCRGGVALK